MIRPRPTYAPQADSLGLFVYHSPATDRLPRTPAWCPHCGAKLSTYRPLGDAACWACQQGEPVDAETLHPPIPTSWQRNSKNPQRADP